MIRPPVYWPSKLLRQEPQDNPQWSEFARVAEDLCDTMNFLGGVGMAAQQIGEPYKVFVISQQVLPEDDLPMLKDCRVFINPEIEVWGEEVEDFEGCLSFPEIFLKVTRPCNVRVTARHIDGQTFTMEAGGLLSRAIQHEYDHISGKLMVDFVGRLKREMVKKKLHKWRKKHDA